MILSKLYKKSLIHSNGYALNNSKRRFSVSNSKFSDIDKILNNLAKHNQDMLDFKRELDQKKEKQEQREQEAKKKEEREQEAKIQEQREQEAQIQELAAAKEAKEIRLLTEAKESNVLTEAKERLDELMNTQEKVEAKYLDRIDKGYEKLNQEKGEEILDKYEDPRDKITNNIYEKSLKLEDEFKKEIKSVDYFKQKLDLEANGFKKLSQILQKEEEEIDKKLKEEPDYQNYKDEYEKERSEWKKEQEENVRNCRKEKQDIKEHLNSNLQKASEMAVELMDETGPDYTGGDE